MGPTAGAAPLRRDRAYVRFTVSRVTSSFGSRLSAIAFPLLVLALGGGALRVGEIASAAVLTGVLCRLPAGAVADRFDRRILMIVMDATRGAALASIPVAAAWGVLGFPQLLTVAMLDSIATAVFGPSALAVLRELAGADRLTAALSQNRAASGAVALAGPVLGGACFSISRTLPFALDAVSYGLSLALLVGLPAARVQRGETGDRRIGAGFRWMWRQPAAMRMTAFSAVVNVVAAAGPVVAVVGLRQAGEPGAVLGAVLACSGAGALAGAVLASRVIRWLGPARLRLAAGAIWAGAFAVCAVAPAPAVVGAALGLGFLTAPACGVMLAQLLIAEAPGDLLGRVSTAGELMGGSLSAAGPLLAGLCLREMGPAQTWLAASAFCAAGVAATAVPWTRARPARSEAAPAPGRAG